MIAFPEELRPLFSPLEATADLDEQHVLQALYEYQTAQTNLPDEIAKSVFAERFVFSLAVDETGEKGPWASFFRPAITTYESDGMKTSHPLGSISPDTIIYWHTRAADVQHSIMRARYADAAWELSPLVQQPRNFLDAQQAVDAYVQRVASSRQICSDMKWLRRALNLALAIRDEERVEHVVEAMYTLHERSADPKLVGTAITLFDTLFSIRKKIRLSEARIAVLISWLEDCLKVVTANDFKRQGPHAVEMYGERLLKYYRSRGGENDIQRVTTAFAGAIEEDSKAVIAAVASAWLYNAYIAYIQANMKADAERLLIRMKDVGRQAQAQMILNVVSEEIDGKSFEAFLDEMTRGSIDACFARITNFFVPKATDLRKRLQMAKEQFPLSLTFPITFFDDGQPIATVGGSDQDEEGRLVHEISQDIQVNSVFLMYAIERMFIRHDLDADSFTDLLYRTPLLLPERYQIVRCGMRHYREDDYIAAVHVLIPQIEHALRSLLEVLPKRKPTNVHNPKLSGFQEKDLGTVLADDAIKDTLGDGATRYLRALLTDQRGSNQRNRLTHGLYPAPAFTRQMADRVIHALMMISFIRVVENEPTPPTTI